MNVLFIHNAFAEYRFEFWRQLKNRINVDLLITHKGLEHKLYGLVDKHSSLGEKYWNLQCLLTLPSLVRSYDIVVLPPTDSIKDFFICLYAQFWCKIRGIKTVLWSETWFRRRQLLHPLKAVKILTAAAMKVIVGNGTDRFVVPGTKSYQYFTSLPIWNVRKKTFIAVDSSTSPKPSEELDIHLKYGVPASSRIILFLGRMLGFKGLDVLVEAAGKLLMEKDVFLIVGGDGPESEYCQSLIPCEAKERIKFIGKVSPSLRRSFYEQADVFVIPSRLRDGCIDIWALTVNEALECGTPVIATTDVGASYDLINERNGRVVPSNDVGALYLALKDVLFESKLYLKRDIITEVYMKNYSINNMVDGFMKAFNNK